MCFYHSHVLFLYREKNLINNFYMYFFQENVGMVGTFMVGIVIRSSQKRSPWMLPPLTVIALTLISSMYVMKKSTKPSKRWRWKRICQGQPNGNILISFLCMKTKKNLLVSLNSCNIFPLTCPCSSFEMFVQLD